MDHQIALSDELYERLTGAAEQAGTTPCGWLDQHLPPAPKKEEKDNETMADVLKDYIGKYRSRDNLRASERVNELFGDYLEQKRREGRL